MIDIIARSCPAFVGSAFIFPQMHQDNDDIPGDPDPGISLQHPMGIDGRHSILYCERPDLLYTAG